MAIKETLTRTPARSAQALAPAWGERLRAARLPAVTTLLVLTASLANFLTYNDYPLFAPESVIIAFWLIGAAVTYGLVYAASARMVRALLELVLIYVAIDFNTTSTLAPAIGTFIAAIVLNRHMIPMLAIISVVVLISAVSGLNPNSWAAPDPSVGPDQAVPSAEKLPVIVHLVLDEHIGVEGLPADMPSGAAMQERLRAFYLNHGFLLFGRAHSKFMHTVNSLPDTFNFGVRPERDGDLKDGVALKKNAYFDHLEELGYRIKVYQSDFIDYCAHGVAICATRRAAGMAPVADSGLPARERAILLAYGFAALSDFVTQAEHVYNIAALSLVRAGIGLPLLDPLRRSPSSVGALSLFNDFMADLSHAKPGDAYIVHLLLPHYPYVTNPDCSLKPIDAWRKRWIARGAAASAYDAYFDQLDCATHKVEAMLEVLDKVTNGDAIMLVHGDHGSRMTVVDPKENHVGSFTNRDMINTYATLFAVRAPGMAAAYDDTPRSLAGLFSAFVKSDFTQIAANAGVEDEGVVLENEAWKPVRHHPLPEGWR